jgi:DMSO/TMAO reductase YedYZ molybdopterin-dependent catalytic subunit
MGKVRSSRRSFLARVGAGAGAAVLAGCDRLSQNVGFGDFLRAAENLSKPAQRALAGGNALAPEFAKADIAPTFRANGTLDPNTDAYRALAANGFRDWRLAVDGLVETPLSLSLAQLRAMPARTQITRHDCVEGWSCIGEWTGVPLAHVLAMARPKPDARFVMFYCADPMEGHDDPVRPKGPFYYESLDLTEATHPQTILAYGMNGETLPIRHGAPIRLRAERQLGYKMAKYVMQISLVDDFSRIHGGKGGYWEDKGYTWWAGI